MKRMIAVLLSVLMAVSVFGALAGSAAEEVKYGDVSQNGEITVDDALLALQFSIGKIQLSDEQKNLANVDSETGEGGVTVSDALLTLAGSTTVITAYRPEAVAAEIQRLIAEHGVTELVLGHPLNMDGTRGPRAEKAEGFAALLRETTGLPVTLWDERRTTVDAHNILMAGGKNAKQRKKTVDAVAASLMLEGYLTFKKRQK